MNASAELLAESNSPDSNLPNANNYPRPISPLRSHFLPSSQSAVTKSQIFDDSVIMNNDGTTTVPVKSRRPPSPPPHHPPKSPRDNRFLVSSNSAFTKSEIFNESSTLGVPFQAIASLNNDNFNTVTNAVPVKSRVPPSPPPHRSPPPLPWKPKSKSSPPVRKRLSGKKVAPPPRRSPPPIKKKKKFGLVNPPDLRDDGSPVNKRELHASLSIDSVESMEFIVATPPVPNVSSDGWRSPTVDDTGSPDFDYASSPSLSASTMDKLPSHFHLESKLPPEAYRSPSPPPPVLQGTYNSEPSPNAFGRDNARSECGRRDVSVKQAASVFQNFAKMSSAPKPKAKKNLVRKFTKDRANFKNQLEGLFGGKKQVPGGPSPVKTHPGPPLLAVRSDPSPAKRRHPTPPSAPPPNYHAPPIPRASTTPAKKPPPLPLPVTGPSLSGANTSSVRSIPDMDGLSTPPAQKRGFFAAPPTISGPPRLKDAKSAPPAPPFKLRSGGVQTPFTLASEGSMKSMGGSECFDSDDEEEEEERVHGRIGPGISKSERSFANSDSSELPALPRYATLREIESTPVLPPNSDSLNFDRQQSEKNFFEKEFDISNETQVDVFDAVDDQKAWIVAQELLTTENSYIEVLETMDDLYFTPLATRPGLAPAIARDPIFAVVYNYLLQMIQINKRFKQQIEYVFQEIQANNIKTSSIGTVFLAFAKQFTYYGHYAKYYELLLDHIQEESQKNQVLDEYLNSVKRTANGRLQTLLIAPVQRLPRYILLLNEMIKKSKLEAGELKKLEKALAEITEITNIVDKTVLERENRKRLLDMSKMFQNRDGETFDLVGTNRYLIHEGFIVKYRRMKTKYYFHLFSDVLLYSEKQLGLNKFVVHRHIWLREARFTDIKNDDKFQNVVQVQMPKKSFRLLFDSPEEKAMWLAKFIETQSNLKHGTDSQELAAVWTLDHETKVCYNCHTKFTMFNRRHHCRSCGRVFCGPCSSYKIVMSKLQSSKPKRACKECFDRILEEQRMQNIGMGIGSAFRRRDHGTETLHMTLIRELKEYSKNLDACLEVFGRPILDACILWGKEIKTSTLRQLLDASGLINTLAIFLHTLEEIVYYTDNLVADLEDSNEENAQQYIFQLGQRLSLYEPFNEHHIKYAERLPLVQHGMRPNGPLEAHVKKCESSGQLPGKSIKDLLALPKDKLVKVMNILNMFEENFRSRDVPEAALQPLQVARSRMFQARQDMLREFRLAELQIPIINRRSHFTHSHANMCFRGRMFLMSFKGQVSLNGNPPRELQVYFFSDSLLFSNKGQMLHRLNFLESMISYKDAQGQVQIVAGGSIYTLYLDGQAESWYKKLRALVGAYTLRKEGDEYVSLATIAIRDRSDKLIRELPSNSVIVAKKRKPNENNYKLYVLQPVKGYTVLQDLEGNKLLSRNIGHWCAISRQRLHEKYNPAYSCDVCQKDVCRICITDNYRPQQLAMQFISKVCNSCRLHLNAECFLGEDIENYYSKPERIVSGRL